MSKNRHRPTPEELASVGARPEMDKVLDGKADPNCPRCHGTGQVYTPDRCRGGHVCPCTLAARPDAGKASPKTYAAKLPDGRTLRCTVPEDPTPDEILFDAIKDNFSPQAVAAMAAYLQAANTKNRRVNQQLTWFAGELTKCVR
ncbi:MAG: hypothetical protein BIFFINMI_03843 [Phycisphaerae bacterium]|nr:hypothetical protein [Phycisphaerae bacterium]